jgi:hypothetical protein
MPSPAPGPAAAGRALAAIAVLCVCLPLRGHAAAPGTEPGFTIVPYGWLAGLDGTVGAPGDGLDDGSGNPLDRIDVTLDPDYELKGFMFYAEWRGERWMAFIDSVWANFRQGGTIKLLGVLPGSNADAEVDGNIVTGGIGFRVMQTEDSALVVFGGARYYDLEVSVTAGGSMLPWSFSSSADDAWTHGLVGAKWNHRLGEDWQTFVEGDYAFGGSGSSWGLTATLGYNFSWGRLFGGWRHMAVDQEKTSYLLDVSLTGPMLGLAFDF